MRTIVITGKRNSGKTFLSKSISMGFKNPSWIQGRYINESFPFIAAEPDTDILIFDDISKKNIHSVLAYAGFEERLLIKRPHKEHFYLKRPVFLINLREEVDVEKYILERPFFESHVEIIVCQRPYPDDFRFKKLSAALYSNDKSLNHVK